MDYIIVGQIINTHGIKGEVKVYPLTDDIDRFDFLKSVFIGEKKAKVNIETVKYHKNIVILKFEEYNDINEIINLKNSFIYIDESQRIKLPKNHFFIYEILNSEVFDSNMDLIGTLVDIIQTSSNDVYIIKASKSKKEYLIPAVKEFIKEIDVENKKIYIDPIEGMLDED